MKLDSQDDCRVYTEKREQNSLCDCYMNTFWGYMNIIVLKL